MTRAGFLLVTVSLTSAAAAQGVSWPHQADIPKAAPVSVGLAGQASADPTRYFLASGPAAGGLSPDGSSLAYISSVTGQPQVWVVSAAGGIPRQLTFGLGVDGMMWVPDGSGVLYVSDKGGDERYGFYWISKDGTNERVVVPPGASFTQPGDFTADGSGIFYATTGRDPRAFDLYVAALDGTGQRLVREGRLGFYPRSAQPNGDLLIASEARGEDAQDISLVNARTGEERPLFRPREASAYGSFSWKPDGSGFYFTTNEGRERSALAFHDLKSAKTSIIHAPESDVISATLSRDGRYLVWSTQETGFHRLHARDLLTAKDLSVPDLPAGTYHLEFARSAAVAWIEISGPSTPGEIWTWTPATGAARQAIPPNSAGLDLGNMVVPQAIRFKARDGVPLSGLLYMPKGKSVQAPVFLRLHGGPSSHARPSWRPEIQYLVAQGIAVLDFNYRGSTGAGKSHARLNDRRLRVNELGDVVDAVEWIKRQSRLDGSRVAVGGASYGGYLTNALLGRYPGLFAAGVSEVGVADWVVNLEAASPQLQASDRVEYGDIRDPKDRAFLATLSPINNAARIKAPLLMQVGANDPRNGIIEQDAFVTAVRGAGGKVIYRRYPDEGHSMRGLANILDWNRTKAEFLVTHLSASR